MLRLVSKDRRRASGGELVVPDLGGDEEVSAVYAGGLKRPADGGFIVVHGGGIDVAKAEGKSAFDNRSGSIARHSESPQS